MKIGIICLANGPYSVFIDSMVNSVREKFLSSHERNFFIITDSKSFDNYDSKDCKTYIQERKGWPDDCLLRSDYVLSISDDLKEMDVLFFFGANLRVNVEIGDEILPDDSGFVAVEHSCFTNRNTAGFTYDRNPLSKAYVPIGEGEIYYQAIVWGGNTDKFLQMSKTMAENILEDKTNNVEALWLDESHLNRYFIDNRVKTLSPNYAWPEAFGMNSNVQIIQLDKTRYLSGNFRYLDPSQNGSGTY